MRATIYIGDVMERLRDLRDECVQCVVTSPPYWGLRDYGTALWEGGAVGCDHRVGRQVPDNLAPGAIRTGQRPGVDASACRKCGATRIDAQLGLEKTPEEYIGRMVEVFREVRRVLRGDGTLWLNMGDSYASGDRSTYRSAASDNKGQQVQDDMPRPKTPPGLKAKDLCGVPWMLAFALRADGWWLRQDIIWSKPNPMPESVTDRCTKAHEYLFLLTKSARYYFDAEAIKEDCVADHPAGNNNHKGLTAYEAGDEHMRTKQGLVAFAQRERIGREGVNSRMHQDRDPSHPSTRKDRAELRNLGDKLATADPDENRAAHGNKMGRGAGWRDDPANSPEKRNKRSVWEIATQPFAEAHFATFPEKLIEPCILAGSKEGDAVLDPFCGSGTTGVVALRYHRDFVGIELNPEYAEMAERRIGGEIPLFAGVEVVRPKLAVVKAS